MKYRTRTYYTYDQNYLCGIGGEWKISTFDRSTFLTEVIYLFQLYFRNR
jgi:hypothetical protein